MFGLKGILAKRAVDIFNGVMGRKRPPMVLMLKAGGVVVFVVIAYLDNGIDAKEALRYLIAL